MNIRAGQLVRFVDNNPFYKNTPLEGTIILYLGGAPGYRFEQINTTTVVMFLSLEKYYDKYEGPVTRISVLHSGKVCYAYTGEIQPYETGK